MPKVLDIQHILEVSEEQAAITRRNAKNREHLKHLTASYEAGKKELKLIQDNIRQVQLEMKTDYENYLQLENLNQE